MNGKQRLAEIHYTVQGSIPRVEITLPPGTPLQELSKVFEIFSKDLKGKLSPRGCDTCHSGCHFFVRERLEEVVRVDLDQGRIIPR
jgi:hypothetical protein